MSYKIISTEKQPRKNGGPRITHIIQCNIEGCLSTLRVRQSELKNKKEFLCISHAHTKRPFESLLNTMKNDHRKLENNITYEQFIEFTKIKNCHYCLSTINWIEYSVVKGEFKSNAYYLDRVDNDKGYTNDNVVVCCTKCNIARGNRYSYEEWFGMTEYFRRSK